jgi:phenylalanyl-tRNA synthetase alpha chain
VWARLSFFSMAASGLIRGMGGGEWGLCFVPAPQTSNKFPAEYLERVKQTHMHGGYGSIGYNYDWKLAEAQKNLMRTHTTAVSSRMLYKLAQVSKRVVPLPAIRRNQ